MKLRLAPRVGLILWLHVGFAGAHGDPHDRIAELTRRLRDDPSADLFFKRGSLRLERRKAVAALADFQEADRLSPGVFETGPKRAEAYLLLGKNSRALEILDLCLEREPGNARCLLLRARASLGIGKPDSAIRDFRMALSLVPAAEPDLLIEVSTVLADHGKAREALEILDCGTARLGPLVSLETRAIEFELRIGNPCGALRRIDAMEAAAPRPEPWMVRRASVLARAGRMDESRVAWQSLIDHISALPIRERVSAAMCSRVREAREALAALNHAPQ